MHPIGLALAFLVFWSLVAVGVFLMTYGGRKLRTGQCPTPFWKIISGVTALVGLTLTGAGIFATYVVLYGP
jgi:hypothetical protein